MKPPDVRRLLVDGCENLHGIYIEPPMLHRYLVTIHDL